MPSTTTTTVTIGTILDLIGPAPQTASSNDAQSGFDTLLQATQSQTPQPTSPPALASPQSPTSDTRPADCGQRANTNDVSHSDDTASNQDYDSTPADPAPAVKPPKAENAEHKSEHNDPDHANEKSDDQIATDQVIAQSLAGLPTAPQNNPVPETAPINETATSNEDAAVAAKPDPAQPSKFTAQLKPANLKAKSAQADAVIQTNTATDGHPQQPDGEQPNSAAAVTTNDSAAQKSTVRVQAADVVEPAAKEENDQTSSENSQQSPDIELAADEKPQSETTQVTRHDQSPPTDTSQPALDATTSNTLTADPANSNNPSAVPLVAPVANITPTADQPSVAPTSNSNNAAAVSGAVPRARLPAQALVPAGSAASRHNPVEIDAARLIGRVVRAFSAAQERDGEIHLRLSPPELGSLRLDVRVENGALTAHLQTETDSARLAILDNLPTLRDRLADQGVRIERFDVDLMQRQAGGMPDQPGGRQPETPDAPLRTTQPAVNTKSQLSIVSTSQAVAVTDDNGLNVIV